MTGKNPNFQNYYKLRNNLKFIKKICTKVPLYKENISLVSLIIPFNSSMTRNSTIHNWNESFLLPSRVYYWERDSRGDEIDTDVAYRVAATETHDIRYRSPWNVSMKLCALFSLTTSQTLLSSAEKIARERKIK